MKCEEIHSDLQIRLWQITDQFGDRIHLTGKELITLYNEIAKQTHQWVGIENKDE